MAVDILGSTRLPRGILYVLGLGVLWLVLALASPTTTYHLAPLLVAGTPPVVHSFEQDRSMTRLTLVTALGLTIALVLAGALALADALRGPSLLPTGGALLESVVFALAGGVGGFVVGVFIIRS